MKFSIATFMISLSFFSQLAAAASGSIQPITPVWRQQLTVAIDEFMNTWSEHAKLSAQTKVNYQISGLDPRLKLSPCNDTPRISTSQKFRAGKLTLKTECRLPHPWKIYVSVHVERLHPVVISTRTMSRDKVIENQDLRLKTENIDRLNFGYFTSIEAVAGMITKRNLQQGSVLSPNQLVPPRLINKGDSVLIEAANSRVRVKMPGLAMSDGRKGQQISVRNTQSRRVIRAEVVAAGIVKVPL